MSRGSAGGVIAGAGIAGVATAYHLAVRFGLGDVVVCDPLPPLSLTSDKSTECYRNWWPGPDDAMVRLVNRSIDLLEEWAAASGNVFNLNRRGYLYVTADPSRLTSLHRSAREISSLGAGPLRVHDSGSGGAAYRPAPPHGFEDQPEGADLIVDAALLHRSFPFLTQRAVGALHTRRAGWLSAQQLGAWLLAEAIGAGATVVRSRVEGVETAAGRVKAVHLEDGSSIRTGAFVNAAGPLLAPVGRMVGVDLPVHSEVHRKLAFEDTLGAVPRAAPLLIWNDPQTLAWDGAESGHLAAGGRRSLLAELPAACHCRPEGGPGSAWVLALWEYKRHVREPVWPLPIDDLYPEVVIKGTATMLPEMAGYLDRLPRPVVDGGYYTKTPENRPLIGPVGPEGSFVAGALSGYGVMAAAAAGELAALHVTGRDLPAYAAAFHPARYDRPGYIRRFGDEGQL